MEWRAGEKGVLVRDMVHLVAINTLRTYLLSESFLMIVSVSAMVVSIESRMVTARALDRTQVEAGLSRTLSTNARSLWPIEIYLRFTVRKLRIDMCLLRLLSKLRVQMPLKGEGCNSLRKGLSSAPVYSPA